MELGRGVALLAAESSRANHLPIRTVPILPLTVNKKKCRRSFSLKPISEKPAATRIARHATAEQSGRLDSNQRPLEPHQRGYARQLEKMITETDYQINREVVNPLFRSFDYSVVCRIMAASFHQFDSRAARLNVFGFERDHSQCQSRISRSANWSIAF